jgi:hypothetical protein
MTALTFLGFLGYHWFNPSDDLPFYFTLAQKLVQTGSLHEPFAARRIATFGGHVYLHATFISVASIYYVHAVDGGIAFVIVVLSLFGHIGQTRRGRLKAQDVLPIGFTVLLLFSLQDVRVNTNSEMTGVAALLTLYRTIRAPLANDEPRPWPIEPRRVLLVAGLVVVSVLLRISNAPTALAFAGLWLGIRYFSAERQPVSVAALRSLARTAALFTVASLVFFLPWLLLQAQSSGTPFYPFGHSNVTPGWTLLVKPKNIAEEATQLIEHVFYDKPVALFLPFALAALLPLAGRARNDLALFSIATLAGLVIFSHEAVAFGPANTARYYFSSVVALSLLVTASVERSAVRASFVAAALAMHIAASRDETHKLLTRYVDDAYSLRGAGDGARVAFEATTDEYVDVQRHVPLGATMATAVYESFRFDFKRNRIFALDVLGGMGPKPGWPSHKGPEALGEYMRACGVEYLVWVDFDLPSEFYGRAHWMPFAKGSEDSYLQGEAVLQLDAEDAIEKLSAMRRVVYRGRGMTVVDLAAAP